MDRSEALHEQNCRLNETEYRLQRLHLQSMPRCLALVFGNGCNIDCVHCYQSKNGDNLLRPPEIAAELRRELSALYPYASTFRVQGGEVFALRGFRELVDDIEATVRRPILSINTNGTMITEEWAERMVRLPFSNVTISIDAGTPGTFAQLRRGANLPSIIANIQRINRWKQELGSQYPVLDSFFVVMRSNFREIPQYFELMAANGIQDLTFQTVQINPKNAGRTPTLERDALIVEESEIRELHGILLAALPRVRRSFRLIRFSGLQSLFERYGLETAFLEEGANGLYPDSDELREASPAFELCPNPWTTLFIIENGDAHICFLAEPIGNIYETPVTEIWNSPKAMAKRSHMIAGRYMQSGCSEQWCSWREGKVAPAPADASVGTLRQELRVLLDRAHASGDAAPADAAPAIGAVRRMLTSRNQQIADMQVLFQEVCDTNQMIHDRGQAHIDHLEAKVARVEAEYAQLRAQTSISRLWRRFTR